MYKSMHKHCSPSIRYAFVVLATQHSLVAAFYHHSSCLQHCIPVSRFSLWISRCTVHILSPHHICISSLPATCGWVLGPLPDRSVFDKVETAALYLSNK